MSVAGTMRNVEVGTATWSWPSSADGFTRDRVVSPRQSLFRRLPPGGERLLCVGESSSQVRAAYAGAWGEVIRDEDRPTVRAISLQRWAGQAWAGQWEHQTFLAVPTTRGGKAGANDSAEAVVAN